MSNWMALTRIINWDEGATELNALLAEKSIVDAMIEDYQAQDAQTRQERDEEWAKTAGDQGIIWNKTPESALKLLQEWIDGGLHPKALVRIVVSPMHNE